MSYKREHYNQIFEAMRAKFGEKWYASISPSWWNIWRNQIMRLFDEGILIREIIDVLDEAANKKQWPTGTAFWHRVRDMVLWRRNQRKPAVSIDTGPQALGSLLKSYPQHSP